jgi:hypothetical protein
VLFCLCALTVTPVSVVRPLPVAAGVEPAVSGDLGAETLAFRASGRLCSSSQVRWVCRRSSNRRPGRIVGMRAGVSVTGGLAFCLFLTACDLGRKPTASTGGPVLLARARLHHAAPHPGRPVRPGPIQRCRGCLVPAAVHRTSHTLPIRHPRVPALQAHAVIGADFFETTTLAGARLYVLAVIGHAGHRIRILAPPRTRRLAGWPGPPAGEIHDPRP